MPVRRVAELLGCSEMTIRRRITARQFPAVRIGRKSMVPRSFVEALLAQAEAGRTVVVDEAVEEWAANAQAQTSPGGIAARRGDASQAPVGEQSTPHHSNAVPAMDERGSVPVLPLVGFAAFLVLANLALSASFVVLAAVTVLAVAVVLGVVTRTLRRDRTVNKAGERHLDSSWAAELAADRSVGAAPAGR